MFKKYCTWVILSIICTSVFYTPVLYPQAEGYRRRYVDCSMKIRMENEWVYDVYSNGRKAGSMTMKVTGSYKLAGDKMYTSDAGDWQKSEITVFTIQVDNGFTGKKYSMDIFYHSYELYIYEKNTGNVYPYLKVYIYKNERIQDLVVTNIEVINFQGAERTLATLQDIKDNHVEKYLDGVGIYYQKNGNVEYKLVKYTFPPKQDENTGNEMQGGSERCGI